MMAITTDKSSLEHVLYRNPHISETVREGGESLNGYVKVFVNLEGLDFYFLKQFSSLLNFSIL